MNDVMVTRDELELTQFQAGKLSKSGLLPNALDTEEKVFAVITFGQELGLKAWQSINGIQVIQGRPTASPQLMLGLIERSGKLENIEITGDEKSCTVMMKRKKRSPHTEVFSMEDAGKMLTTEWVKGVKTTLPLSKKYNWRTMPKVMLKWRAVAACARVVFSDVICGLYLHEEIDPNIQVSSEGEIIEAEVLPQVVFEKASSEASQNSAKVALEAPKTEEKSTVNDAKNDSKRIENGNKNASKTVQKSTGNGTKTESKTNQKQSENDTKKEPEIVVPNDAIPEVSWKAPWIALGQKNYPKDEAEKFLRNLYNRFLMPDGSPKTSTKQINQKELDQVLLDIEKLDVKEAPTKSVKKDPLKSENISLEQAIEEVTKHQKISLRAKMALKKSCEGIEDEVSRQGALQVVNDLNSLTVEIFLDIAKGLIKRDEA